MSKFPKWSLSLGFPTKSHLPLVQCVLHPCLLHWFDWYGDWPTEQFIGFARLYGRIVQFVTDLLLRNFFARFWNISYRICGRRSSNGTDFSAIISVLPIQFIWPLLHIRNSLTYQRRYIILAVDSTVEKTNFSLPVSLQPSLLQPFCQKSSQALYVPCIETRIFAPMFNKGWILIYSLLEDKKTNWTEC
jgi:hypothetical protein